jgi:hypothetical protein
MSMTVWLNVRSGEKYESDGEDRSAIFALQDQIDRLTSELGVVPLSAFFDETDVRYNMDDDGAFDESEEGWPASAARWYDPAQVLRTVEALCSHLEGNQNCIALTDGWSQDQVLENLRSLMPGLRGAATANKAVHLLVVM